MEIAIDSSVMVGLLVPNDHRHVQAVSLWEAIESGGHTGIYFDCVAAETVSVALRRLHERRLVNEIGPFLNQFDSQIPPEVITWVLPDVSRLYSEIIGLIRDTSGTLNFNDGLIALACRERGIPAIASFDEDFDRVSWLQRLASPEDL
jgi:predicted nucleic acid-binding protein